MSSPEGLLQPLPAVEGVSLVDASGALGASTVKTTEVAAVAFVVVFGGQRAFREAKPFRF